MQKRKCSYKKRSFPNVFIGNLQRLPLCNNQRQRPLKQVQGFPIFTTAHGFTLIELLVVVLIIGILAAVAVPQYQKAVLKSRVSTLLPVLQSLANAQEAYYLANGSYTVNATLLDVDMPAECTDTGEESGRYWSCGKHFLINFNGSNTGDWQVGAQYCPNNTDTYANCKTVRDFSIYFDYLHQEEGNHGATVAGRRCYARTQAGATFCKNLPDYTHAGTGAN